MDVRPLVLLANAAVERWCDDGPLECLHAPLAAGEEPPPLGGDYWAPLVDLRLPPDVRFVAGLAEDRTVARQQELFRLTEDMIGRSVDVPRTPPTTGIVVRSPHNLISAALRVDIGRRGRGPSPLTTGPGAITRAGRPNPCRLGPHFR